MRVREEVLTRIALLSEGGASAAGPHQVRGTSGYARKNGAAARTSRWRLRLGLFECRTGIMCAAGQREGQWRNSASADGSACAPFFELTPRAARIVPRTRRDPTAVRLRIDLLGPQRGHRIDMRGPARR